MARLVQHATVKQDELSSRIVSYFKEHFVQGEEVFALRDGKEAALRIAECRLTAESTHDCTFSNNITTKFACKQRRRGILLTAVPFPCNRCEMNLGAEMP